MYNFVQVKLIWSKVDLPFTQIPPTVCIRHLIYARPSVNKDFDRIWIIIRFWETTHLLLP